MPYSKPTDGIGFLRHRMNRFMSLPVRIFRITLPRYRWLVIALGSGLLLTAYGMFTIAAIVTGSGRELSPGVWIAFSMGALGAAAWFYMLLHILRVSMNALIAITLVLSGASFLIEIGLLDAQLIGRLTPRTIWVLCIAFAALAVYPFHQRLPGFLLPVLAGVYVPGALLCLSFVAPMLPFMAFGWLAIPFAGVGFLPYSPLLALITFSLAIVGVHRHARSRHANISVLRPVQASLVVTILVCLAYSGWFLLEWNKMNAMVDKRVPSNRLDHELPRWTALAARFPGHHVARMYLSERAPRRGFASSVMRSDFDPLAYAASTLLNRSKLSADARGKMYALITGDTHSNLQRLWSGENLKTVRVATHVQIFPETRMAYTETTLTVHNDSDRTREAIYTLKLPSGSAASQLSLWINGREEPARLALKEKARAAYRQIVGVEARDPALLEWREGSRLRLRVFPVFAGKRRKVRFGIVTPLKREWTSEEPLLTLPAVKIIGPDLGGAKHALTFHVVSSASGRLRGHNLNLTELAPLNGLRRFRAGGNYNENWKLWISAPERIEGRFVVGKDAYVVEPIQTTTTALFPDDIYLLVNDTLSSQEWIRAYREIAAVKQPRTRIIIAGAEKFTSDNELEMIRYLRRLKPGRFNLFPFHRLPRGRRALLVTAGELRSTTISDLAGSAFHQNVTRYFARRKTPIYVATLNGRFSDYLKGLMEFSRVRAAAYSRPGLLRVLRTNQVEIPQAGTSVIAFPGSGISIRKLPAGSLPVNRPGLRPVSLAGDKHTSATGDAPARLFLYRRLMKLIGRSHFRAQADKKPALAVAADAMLVSPVSSLVVLESERDYNRFGIKKQKSKLGQSKKLNPTLGLVPEPEEWALLIFILAALAYHRRRQLSDLLQRFGPVGRTA